MAQAIFGVVVDQGLSIPSNNAPVSGYPDMPFGVFEYSLGIVTGNPLGFDRPVFEALGIFSKQEDACAVGCYP